MLTLKAAALVDIDAGEIVRPGILRIDGPRIVPAGHPITPTGGHLDPTMFNAMMRACCRSRLRRASPTACPRSGTRSGIRSSTGRS